MRRIPFALSRWSPVAAATAYVAGHLALDLASAGALQSGEVIAPWHPSPGLSLALLLLLGPRYWPLVLATVLAGEVLVGQGQSALSASALAAVITAGYAGLAVLLLGPLKIDTRLATLRDLSWLVAGGALASSFVASGHVALHALEGQFDWIETPFEFLKFWIADAIGLFVVTPLVLVLTHGGVPRPADERIDPLEALMQGVAILAALAIMFLGEPWAWVRNFYLLFLPLIWITVRWGLPGATIAIVVIQIGLIAGDRLLGDVMTPTLDLQIRMLALAVTGLFLGAAISGRRSAEERVRRQQVELDRALRMGAAAETASSLAHELHQPLTAVTNYARALGLMIRAPAKHGDRLAHTVERIEHEVGRAGDIVRRIRDFVRSGASAFERIAVADLVREAIAPSRARAAQHFISIEVRIADGLPPVDADRVQMQAVLHNLVSNAIDAITGAGMPRGEIVVSATTRTDRSIVIAVSDSGPGVPNAVGESLFEPFASAKPDGMGLGLAISRSIVENHGGRLWAESRPGGCTLAFTLPTDNDKEDRP